MGRTRVSAALLAAFALVVSACGDDASTSTTPSGTTAVVTTTSAAATTQAMTTPTTSAATTAPATTATTTESWCVSERAIPAQSEIPVHRPPFDFDDPRAEADGAVFVPGMEAILLDGPTLTTTEVTVDALQSATTRIGLDGESTTVGVFELTGEEEVRLRVSATEPTIQLVLFEAEWCMRGADLTSSVTLLATEVAGVSDVTVSAIVDGTEIATTEPVRIESRMPGLLDEECSDLTTLIPGIAERTEIDWDAVGDGWGIVAYTPPSALILVGPEGDAFVMDCLPRPLWEMGGRLLALSPDRRLLVRTLTPRDGTIIDLRVDTEYGYGPFGDARVYEVAFADNGTMIVLTDDDRLWVRPPGAVGFGPTVDLDREALTGWLPSPDGTVVVAAMEAGLAIAPLDGSEEPRLLVPTTDERRACSPRAWWPDGRALVACVEDAPWVERGEVIDGPPGWFFDDLWLLSTDDATMERLTPRQTGPEKPISFTMAWPTEDGAILRATGERQGVYRMDGTGRVRRLDFDLPPVSEREHVPDSDCVLDVAGNRLIVMRIPFAGGIGPGGMLASVDVDGGDPIIIIPYVDSDRMITHPVFPGSRGWENRETSAL
jgi:hypothetical protein